MKRFLLFKGNDHYPVGGAWDLVGAYDQLPNVPGECDWAHVFDTHAKRITQHWEYTDCADGWVLVQPGVDE